MSVRDDERQCQQAVFSLLLESYPAMWTFEEIIRELASDYREFAERDLIQNSIRDLVGYELLHRQRDAYFATRAAIHAASLQT